MTHPILSSSFESQSETRWKRSSNFLFRVFYHLILFTPKARPMITQEISVKLDSIFKEITQTKGYVLFGTVIHPNHAHLLLGVKPTHFVPNIVKDIRERTSFLIMRKYKYLQRDHKIKKLWSRNFAVETIGCSDIEAVKHSLQDEESHHIMDEWEKYLWQAVDKNSSGEDLQKPTVPEK